MPLIVIIGKKAADPDNPLFELHLVYEDKMLELTLSELIAEVAKYSQTKLNEDI